LVILTWVDANGNKDFEKCETLGQAEQFIQEQISAGMTFCDLEVCGSHTKYSVSIFLKAKEVNE
jgi:hypothetical protein